MMSYGGEHGDVVAVVPGEGEDAHALAEPLYSAEVDHEAVLLAQRLQRPPLSLVLTQRLQLALRRQEAHQTLQEVHTHRTHIKPEHSTPTEPTEPTEPY